MRLVYTVEVDEAIRDKRDHFADDMRQELATAFGFHSGEGRVTRDELQKLDEKVHVSQPETAIIRITVQGQGGQVEDRRPLQQDVPRRARPRRRARARTRSPSRSAPTSSRRSASAPSPRRRTPSPAASTSSACARPRVTTRDEDIIVEVPGSDEAQLRRASRRSSARPPASSSRWWTTAGARRSSARSKEDSFPPTRGSRPYREGAPDGLDGERPQEAAPGVLRAHRRASRRSTPTEAMTECLDALQGVDVDARACRTITSSASRPVTEPVPTPSRCSSSRSAGAPSTSSRRAEVTGDYITDAQRRPGPAELRPVLRALTFSPAGADRFEEITGANINRRFAIILDDIVDSAPVIRTKIGGGRAQHHDGRGRSGEAAARRQAARARAPLGRAAGSDHAEQRVGHRPVAGRGRDREGR